MKRQHVEEINIINCTTNERMGVKETMAIVEARPEPKTEL